MFSSGSKPPSDGTLSEVTDSRGNVVGEFSECKLREPCKHCGEADRGLTRTVNGQDTVRCAACNRHLYNAPKSETGKAQRVIKSRPDLGTGQREHILARDYFRCALCGRAPQVHNVVLHVAHILSVKEGREQGASDAELFDDANLFAACEECNIGLGSQSLDALMVLRLIRARLTRNGGAK